jgi:hypothetical protein
MKSPREDRRPFCASPDHLNLAGGSNGRTARAVFHDAHFPDELPRANCGEQDGIAIEFSEYVDGTAD